MAHQNIISCLALLFASAVQPAAADGQERAATIAELTQFCTDEGLANFGVLSVDQSRAKPFDIVVCERKKVTQKDCLWMGKMLAISDTQFSLNPEPRNAEQLKITERRQKQLANAYHMHCGLF